MHYYAVAVKFTKKILAEDKILLNGILKPNFIGQTESKHV